MDLDPELDLSFQRIVPVPRAAVWACWTTPALIQQFFVPRPHRVVSCEIDLRVGGVFNTVFEVDGTEMTNAGVYLEVINQTRLVFTDTYTAGWKPAPDPFMTALLDLADDGQGGTIYTATARHRTAAARQQHEDMGFYQGWGIVVDQMVEVARTL